MRLMVIIGLVAVTLGLSAVRAKPEYASVLIKEVPHVLQRPDFCGEACAEMVLRKLGHEQSQDDVFARSGLDPALGRGLYTPELKKTLEKIGFKPGKVWYHVKAKAEEQIEKQFQAMHKDLEEGIASIVCMHFDERPKTTEHFRLVVGYDRKHDQIIFHEPAITNGAYRRMRRERFLELWPLKYRKDRWTLVRLRMEPDEIVAAKATSGFTPADFAQHVIQLKKKVPKKGFHIVIQPPFVVVGDESARAVRARAKGTIKWAIDLLKEAYFKKDPEHIIDIWLFKNKKSYRKHTKSIFNENPGTPFGYYSETHRALIMNIATGGGTLVHEIVHPFVKSNFPGCPSWLNEGLGSLYEQCGERDGEIKGFTNWRLAGLQTAIKAGQVPSFEDLTSTTEHEFYNEDSGTNYAQARYLCYYLQEKGLLFRYYHEFLKNKDSDPTGYKTLQKILDEDDMQAFQKKWEAFVLKLTFP
jgi:hypothetical protein